MSTSGLWLPLLGILSFIPQLQSLQAVFQFELPPFLLKDSKKSGPGMMGMRLVTQVLITLMALL